MERIDLYCYLILSVLLFSGSSGYKISAERELNKEVKFGVKIGILPTGKLTQFAVFYYKNNRFAGTRNLTEDELIKMGTGKWPIPGTNNFHNFFEENGFVPDTTESGEIIDYYAAFDSLWKVRFSEHPIRQGKDKGWSQGDYRPSLKQQAYIFHRYGVRGYDQDYFSDTSFYKLLKDVTDPVWIEHYKSMK
ncbi:MAG: hypothetical protein R3277_02500 [Brumimicrobium sp.]|nr:hypothetical protein [Brumimicrobium sp.]